MDKLPGVGLVDVSWWGVHVVGDGGARVLFPGSRAERSSYFMKQGLSIRATKVLWRGDVKSTDDMVYDSLRNIDRCGVVTANEILDFKRRLLSGKYEANEQ